eukprot:3931297-Rhodomonas_salina.1
MWMLAVCCYLVFSIGMVLSNKAIASSLDISELTFVIVLFQNFVAACVMCGTMVRTPAGRTALRSVLLWRARWLDTSVLACVLVGQLVSGIAAMEYLPIATVVVMKTVGPVLTILGEVCFFGERVEYTTLLASVIMIAASCAYARFDVGFSRVGYAFIGVNVLCSTGYSLMLQRVIQKMIVDAYYVSDVEEIAAVVFADAGEAVKAETEAGSVEAGTVVTGIVVPGTVEAGAVEAGAVDASMEQDTKGLLVLTLNVLSVPILVVAAAASDGNQFARFHECTQSGLPREFIVMNVVAASLAAGIGYVTVWLISIAGSGTVSLVGSFSRIPLVIL